MDEKLNKLIALSRELANPANDLAILGEGNTSADCEDGTFWVKHPAANYRPFPKPVSAALLASKYWSYWRTRGWTTQVSLKD